MAIPQVAWEQTTLYLAATDTRITPGGPTTYAVARPVGLGGPTDVTAYHPGQHLWDVADNLPSILYQLRPPEAWYTFKYSGLPTQKLDVNNMRMFEPFPKPGGPDIIGSDESALILEAWRRLDPRIRWSDITMRMDRASRPNENALNMRACRYWRPAYSLISWHGKGTSRKETNVIALLTDDQHDNNTTRGTTPGLINPHLGVAGGRIDHPVHRNGQGQGRTQRTVTASSTAEGDDEESDDSDETSDDDYGESNEEEHQGQDRETEELNAYGDDEELYWYDEPGSEEEIDADGELDVDGDLDDVEESGSVAADELDRDSYGVLLNVYEKESYSDSSFHSPISVAARRTEHDKYKDCQGQKGADAEQQGKDNNQIDEDHFQAPTFSEDGGMTSVPYGRTAVDTRDYSDLPDEFTFGPLEAEPPWGHSNQADHVVEPREKRRRDPADSDTENDAVAKRRMLRAQSLASFKPAARGRPGLLRDSVFYNWRSPFPILASTADDHADQASVNTDLGLPSLSEVDELLSFAGSGLKPSITGSSVLSSPSSGILGIDEPSFHLNHSDAT